MDQVGYKDMRLRNDNMITLKEAIHEIEKDQGRYPNKYWVDLIIKLNVILFSSIFSILV